MLLTRTYIKIFTINSPVTGESVEADEIPSVSIYKNGEYDTMGSLFTVSLTDGDPSTDIGIYKIEASSSFSELGCSDGDKIDILIYAIVGGAGSRAVVDSFYLDNGQVQLSANGLDNIPSTEPSGVATTFKDMIIQIWMRFFNKVTKDSSSIVVYNSSGNPQTTQSITEGASSQILNKATGV